MTFLIIYGIIAIISAIILYHEINNAIIVDAKEPFLWDDYNEKIDKTLVG